MVCPAAGVLVCVVVDGPGGVSKAYAYETAQQLRIDWQTVGLGVLETFKVYRGYDGADEHELVDPNDSLCLFILSTRGTS